MNILHLYAGHHWTGPADPIITLCKALEQRGHKVRFAASTKPSGNIFGFIEAAGVSAYDQLYLNHKFRPGDFLHDVITLRRYIIREGIEIVHCHFSHDYSVALCATIGLLGRVALIRSVHKQQLVQSAALRLGLRGAGRIIVPASSWLPEVRDPKRWLLHGGHIDITAFRALDTQGHKAQVRAEYGVPDDAFVFACVARMQPWRGHEQLLEAFQQVAADRNDAWLLLIGRGEHRAELEKQAVALPCANRIVFCGYQREGLEAHLHAADAFVLMRSGSDATCRAALEAMATSLPVIAGDVASLPDMVLHNETGFVYPRDETATLVRYMLAVAADPLRAKEMGAAGRKRVEQHYDLSAASDTMLAIYEDAIAELRQRRLSA